VGPNQSISHENGGSTVLVLSRKSQESVIVGDFDRLVKVTVFTIGGDTVTRRIDGDAEVPIHRFGGLGTNPQ
jgi:hypothetical protein